MFLFIKNFLSQRDYKKELKKEKENFQYLHKILILDKEDFLDITRDINFLPIEKYKFPELVQHREIWTLNNERYFDWLNLQ